jgi:arginyl-tRNA--protein-N-Asp/Glu arginylyltransferase
MDYKLKFKPNELLINGIWTKPDPKAIQNLSYFIK